MNRLQNEWVTSEKSAQFESLKGYLTPGGESKSYREIGELLGMTEGTVKVTVHRLRRAYRAQLRDVIAETVSTENDIEEEIQDLLGAFGD